MEIRRSFCQGFYLFLEILQSISLIILNVYHTELIPLLNLRRYALYYANKGLLDGDFEVSSSSTSRKYINIRGSLCNNNILFSLPVVRFSLLEVGSYNFAHTCLQRMYSSTTEAIWKTPSWMRMTIRVAVIAVHVGF